MLRPQLIVGLGALSGAISVAAGAFGAHSLKQRLAPDLLAVFETAARYQMYHALALVLVGLLALSDPSPWLRAAAACFLAGTVLFSGSLYALPLTSLRPLGVVTPFGGLFLLAGWVLLAAAALRART